MNLCHETTGFIINMKNLLELIASLYGKKALTKTIGTRTNVISLSNKKLKKYITDDLNIEAASDAAAVNAYKEMEKLIVDVPKMNDGQRLIFEGNLRRAKNKLQASGIIEPDQTADVLSMSTKKPVSEEGIKQLIKEGGQKNPPGSLLGNIESRLNKIKATTEEMKEISGKETVGDFLNDYFNLQKTTGRGRSLEDQAYVRAAVRQIMYTDFNAGKLKFSKELEEMAMGKTNKDPIEVFRKLYGEDALEQIDDILPQIKTLTKNMEAEELARSKFNFEPKLDRPKGSYTDEEMRAITDKVEGTSKAEVVDIKNKVSKNVDPDQLIQEYNSNYKLLSQTDEEGGTLIGYEQFNKLQNRNTEIEKMLDSMGVKPAPKVEPEGTVIPFKKDDPDKFAGGGSVGLDYLMGIERPYATGGRVSYANGSEEARSITLDSHDKAPENFDKYPVKVGENLGLDIKGRMVSGSSNPNRYAKVKTAERDFSVRGKYNVPETSLSIKGGIGDIRFRENVDINVPEYNYKENIRNVMRANPSSIGAEYKLGPNSLISGSRDSTDGRDTYNLGYKYGPVSIDYRDSPEGKDIMARLRMPFAKGGLAYLMGF
jgi:hypothetical protein